MTSDSTKITRTDLIIARNVRTHLSTSDPLAAVAAAAQIKHTNLRNSTLALIKGGSNGTP